MDPLAAIILANSPERASHLLVLDMPELVDAAQQRADKVSVWCDDRGEAASTPDGLALPALDAGAIAGIDLAWLRLPTALGALDEYAELVAAAGTPDVQLIAAGREKFLNRTMNEVLATHFTQVRASLGERKARALLASGPIAGTPSWPRSRELEADQLDGSGPLEVWWHGGTFASGRLDAGTRLLVQHLDLVAEADRYLDLGSGSGILAALLARAHPDSEVAAVDASWAAVDATRRTAGSRVATHWASDLAMFGDGVLDVIVSNPPFHRGTAKDSDPAIGMFAEAARTLGEGGEFWCVHNSHLPWRTHLERLIGPTRQVAQDRHYRLTRSVRSFGAAG